MTSSRARPATRGELYWWMFMRISGIVLLVLAVGHVLIMHVGGTGIDRVDFGFVAVRWQHPFWRTWDWLMLSLALLHGVNGLRVITLDYVRLLCEEFTELHGDRLFAEDPAMVGIPHEEVMAEMKAAIDRTATRATGKRAR